MGHFKNKKAKNREVYLFFFMCSLIQSERHPLLFQALQKAKEKTISRNDDYLAFGTAENIADSKSSNIIRLVAVVVALLVGRMPWGE